MEVKEVKISAGLFTDTILHHNMASKSSVMTNVSNQSGGTKPSIEDQMANLVKRVGEVERMVIASPLYWESIELLSKDEILRGVSMRFQMDASFTFLNERQKPPMRESLNPFMRNIIIDSCHLQSPSYNPCW
ncbi:hypothetical protein Bca52824_028800 [Brassica carinata]|uniref:Uncharacterized protein n=1 Tax=Brassica carinata TaxID=52824 RepID=A0A8X8AQQ3_BRACI|nr:hypothetical protein Bca52824_028800 [Brassica carinata]